MTPYLVIAGIGVVALLIGLIFDDMLNAGPDWLTATVLGAGFTVQGLTGLTLTSAGVAAPVTAAVSVGVGVAAAVGTIWVTRKAIRLLSKGQEPALTAADMAGVEGRSIAGAAPGVPGEIMLVVRGQRLKVHGVCPDELTAGDRVWVSRVDSPTLVYVTRV